MPLKRPRLPRSKTPVENHSQVHPFLSFIMEWGGTRSSSSQLEREATRAACLGSIDRNILGKKGIDGSRDSTAADGSCRMMVG